MMKKSPAMFCLTWQLFTAGFIACCLLLKSSELAYSFIIGASIFIFSNLYFTVYTFRFRGAQYSECILRSIKWGVTGKLVLSALGFALVFKFVKSLSIMALFSGFSAMVILQWFIAARAVLRKQVSEKR